VDQNNERSRHFDFFPKQIIMNPASSFNVY